MRDPATDPLELGQCLVAVLEGGRRVATYKLATLIALLDFAIEHLPEQRDNALSVPVRDLAARVIEIYWPQVLPFEGVELKQTTQPAASILQQTVQLHSRLGAGASLAIARQTNTAAYESAVSAVTLTLVRQPLHRLQRVGPDGARPFRYDDTWMHDHVSAKQLAAHDGRLLLFPGVAWALARLAGLLKPLIETIWVADVRQWNKHLNANVPNIAGHLFGRDRISLTPARIALMEAYGQGCFYCQTAVGRNGATDHVLPWSRICIDGLTNLVLACQRCNSEKSHTLPRSGIVEQAVTRDAAILGQLAQSINWPLQRERTILAARGLYRAQPVRSPVWAGYKHTQLSLGVSENWLLPI